MKKDKRSIKWLYSELPELVSEGVLSEEVASTLKERYGEVAKADTVKIALIIFGIIGSVLIGGGIILILAHNWADMPRSIRAFFSFLPLLSAQTIAGYTLYKKNESTAWKEGAGAFLMLSLGSAIALVGQTYHVTGNLGSFLFSWMILSLPVIYLLRCTTASLFYMAGIVSWMGYKSSENGNLAFFLVFLALLIPSIIVEVMKNRYSVRSTVVLWGLTVILPIATGIGIESFADNDLWYIGFSSVFAIFYLVGNLWFDGVRFPWKKPLQTVGGLGILFLTVLFTFDEIWDWFDMDSIGTAEGLASLGFYLSLVLGAVALAGVAIYKKRYSLLFFGVMPLLAVIGGFIGGITNEEAFGMVIFNIYMAVLGISTIVVGIRGHKLGRMNGGMAMLSLLILLRFFDSDASILLRGIAFILIGVGFLATNIVIVRRQRGTLDTTGGKDA